MIIGPRNTRTGRPFVLSNQRQTIKVNRASSVINISSQLPKWKAALARATTSRLIYLSDANGMAQSNTIISGTVALANTIGGNASTNSFFGVNTTIGGSNPFIGANTVEPRLVTSNTVTVGGPSIGSLGSFPLVMASNTAMIDYTPDRPVDTIEVYHVKDIGTGSITVGVDGGAAIATLTRSFSSSEKPGLTKTVITVPLGTHTFNFRWVSGSFGLNGAIFLNSTVKETHLLNISINSSKASDLGLATNSFSPMNAIAMLNADMLFLQQPHDDVTSLTDMQTFKGQIGTIVTTAKSYGLDVIMATKNPYDPNLTNSGQPTQQSYVNAFKQVATNLAIPCIDVFAYCDTYASMQTAGRMSTSRWLNTAGKNYVAAFIKAGIDTAVASNALSYPAPVTIDVTDVASLLAASPTPGSTVRLQRGTTYAGPISLNWVGASDAPITLTTYGNTLAQAVVTGVLSSNTASPNYVDSITLNSSNLVIDGGVTDDGKLGMWIKDTGRAGLFLSAGQSNITMKRVEVSNAGAGSIINANNVKAYGMYLHDLIIVKNTNGGGANTQVAGEPNAAAWDDDDYGANGFIMAGNNIEIAYCRIMRDVAPSFDYGSDGGAFEFFPSARTMSGTYIHDNWVEGGNGVVEGGATTGSGAVVDDVRIQGNIFLNNISVGALHNGGGNFASGWTRFDVSKNTIVEENNVISSIQTWFLDSATTANLAGFAAPYGFHNNIVQLNNGRAVFKQTETTSHRDNVFNLLNREQVNSGSGTDGTKTHLYTDYGMTLGTGESYADPLFVNQAARNFALQSGSPAVGKGYTAWTPVVIPGITLPTDYNKPN